jgi:hypothetical protein
MVSFSIETFLESLPKERVSELCLNECATRLTQKHLLKYDLADDFKIWKREQHRLRKNALIKTDSLREKNRVDKAVSRKIQNNQAESRQDALSLINPNWLGKPAGPIPKKAHFLNGCCLSKILCGEVLKKLETTVFPKESRRKNAILEGQSITLGKVFNTKTRKINESSETKNRPNLYNLLKSLIKKELPNFSYTSMTVNKNVVTRPHTDKFNLGPSVLISFGNFKGGSLVIKENNVEKEFLLDGNQLLYFWGNNNHYNKPIISGTKYTIIYYSIDNGYGGNKYSLKG